jgi:neopullulanase
MLALFMMLSCQPAATDTDDVPAIITPPTRSCRALLEVDKPPTTQTIQVAGAFNDWLPATLTDEDGDGVFSRDLGELAAGIYPYKLVLDGEWEEPPPDVYTMWEGGFENRKLKVEDCQQPELSPISGQTTPTGTLNATFQYTRSVDGSPLGEVTATVGGMSVVPSVDEQTGLISIDVSNLPAGKHSVHMEADGATAFLPLWVEDTPYDWSQGVLYFVFTDRFRDGFDDGTTATAGAIDGTDYAGGDLTGALDAMEEGYFEDLGVTSIWLSPVYENPDGAFSGSFGYLYTGYHGYWPVEAKSVEERIGGGQALHDFVDAAHDRGIRVLLDTVLNHVHEEHEYIVDHPEWFTSDPCPCTTDAGECNWDTNPLGCWFTDYLPDLDYRNPEVVEQVVQDTLWWVEEYDIDGLRVDAAKHMDHVVMRTMALEIQRRFEQAGGAEFYLVGETFTGQGGQGLIMDYVADYELDGQFDFPLLYPIRNAVGQSQGWRALADEVNASNNAYGTDVHRMSVFMGNHDVGRYVTDMTGCDGYDPYTTLFQYCWDPLDDGASSDITEWQWKVINTYAMSYAFVVTQPGVPLLYYGDDIALAGAGDPDNRRMMPWSDLSLAQQTLRQRMQQLGQTRNQVTALHTGERRELWVDDTLYVYARHTSDGAAIVALHIGDSVRTTDVPIPEDLNLNGASFDNADALDNPRVEAVHDNVLTLTLAPWEYVVLH